MNAVDLIGVVVTSPKYEGDPAQEVVRLVLRTTYVWYNPEGRRERKDFHRLQFTQGKARVAMDYAKRGVSMAVEGTLLSIQRPDGSYEAVVHVRQFTLLQVRREKNATCPTNAQILYVETDEA